MSNNKGFSSRAEAFLTGKGFYIVLFLCVAVIGVSAWLLLLSGNDVSADDKTTSVISVDDNSDPESSSDVIADDSQQDTPVLAGTEDESDDAALNTGSENSTEVQVTAESPDEETNTVQQENTTEAVSNETAEADITFIWPLSGSVSQEYSITDLIYNKTMSDWRTHDGLDIEAQIGAKVMAIADGTVKSVFTDDMYGTTVIIDHGSGIISTYSNLAATPTVEENDVVSMGDTIGAVGDTALAETGEVSHLHFSMTADGVSVNPSDYLPDK